MSQLANKDSARLVLDPPTFSPPPDMRAGYLGRHKEELAALFTQAKAGEWEAVSEAAHKMRGTGGMYGFAEIGAAAGALAKALDDENNAAAPALLEEYARAVNAAYV